MLGTLSSKHSDTNEHITVYQLAMLYQNDAICPCDQKQKNETKVILIGILKIWAVPNSTPKRARKVRIGKVFIRNILTISLVDVGS